MAHEAIHNPVQVPGDGVRRTEEKWDRWKFREVSHEERIAKYKGMTLPIDEGVGRLRRTLVELGIAERTFVLFFSDNGASIDFPSGSPQLRGRKGGVYEGGHKVPAIAWWPGKIDSGATSDQTMISIDVMPTLLAIAGVDAISDEKPLDGIDISSVLIDREALPDRPLFWASLSNGGDRSEAMRLGHWKLVVKHPGATKGTFENPRLELYELESDPSEESDVAKLHVQRATEMHEQLKDWYKDLLSTATPQPGGWSQ